MYVQKRMGDFLDWTHWRTSSLDIVVVLASSVANINCAEFLFEVPGYVDYILFQAR